MAQFELNIYGNDDEILKTCKTDRVRWGVYLQALELQEKMAEKSAADQFRLINAFLKKIFPDLTDEDLELADGDDVMNTFKQLIAKSKAIGSSSSGEDSKNA
jgi:hypothetical protein